MRACSYCGVPDPTGLCPRCRKEYGRIMRERRYWTPERVAAWREAEMARVKAEGVALNRRYGFPDDTTWSVPFERCECDYCRSEGMHPDKEGE